MRCPLKKEKPPLNFFKGGKIDILTRYHLVSRQRASHIAPFPASRKFRRWLGISSSPQRPSAFAGAPFGNHRLDDSLRFNGRTRVCLPIDTPAPRPCSAIFFRAHFHHTGLSDRLMFAYSSLHSLLSTIPPIIVTNAAICQCQITFPSLSATGRPLRR